MFFHFFLRIVYIVKYIRITNKLLNIIDPKAKQKKAIEISFFSTSHFHNNSPQMVYYCKNFLFLKIVF